MYSNEDDNQRRYHSIGRLVDNHVYTLLERVCELQRITIPIDPRNNEPTGFFFASDDILSAKFLMIIIHGTGVVRAGQWSRKLIINENLSVGSQIDYILRAKAHGYAVIVTNTNLNIDESFQSIHNKPRYIRGSSCAEEHACYIWENFIQRSSAPYICIVAHSYGGAVVLKLASQYMSEFDKRVFAVALTDSPMSTYAKYFSSNVLRMLQMRTINWIASPVQVNTDVGIREYGRLRSAGHTSHEWTSYTAFDGIFQFLKEERQKLERYKY
ncbi:unnamed protein product [Adineta steineri]|uniref:Arb2 domain-containing protein n=1 Tax=Adineta steineri TaxID=433720 RepID=A0A813QUV9_9BILA|nr:unnamed protein product [Adineta steineri]CAF1508352.1 unnamed protein product [Adineta steineri]